VPLLLFSITGFVTMFLCFPVVKKYLPDPHRQETGPPAEKPSPRDI